MGHSDCLRDSPGITACWMQRKLHWAGPTVFFTWFSQMPSVSCRDGGWKKLSHPCLKEHLGKGGVDPPIPSIKAERQSEKTAFCLDSFYLTLLPRSWRQCTLAFPFMRIALRGRLSSEIAMGWVEFELGSLCSLSNLLDCFMRGF